MRRDVEQRRAALRFALLGGVHSKRRLVDGLAVRLQAQSPRQRLELRRAEIRAREAQLRSLSPIGTLERGYSITLDEASGRLVRSAAAVAAGRRLRTITAEGSIHSDVVAVDVPPAALPPPAEQMYDEPARDG
jgi:exonuclease VII large subunit